MSFLQSLKRDATRCVVAPDGRVYQIRRIRSADLAQHAVAELVGGVEVHAEIERIKAEQKAAERQYKIERTPKEQRQKAKENAEAAAAHAEQTANLALMRMLSRSPARFAQFAERIDAYCAAGIIGGGTYTGPELGEGFVGQVPESECEIEALAFVVAEEAEDLDAGKGWVGRIDQTTRNWLCGAISTLSGSPSVAPFRP